MDVYEPQSLTFSNAEVLALATQEETALVANGQVEAILYQNAATINRNTTIGDLVEADFGGYSRKLLTAWSGPYMDPNGNAFLLAPLQVFAADGTSSNTIQGMAIVKQNAGVQATATNPGNGAGDYDPVFTITAGGTLYESAPAVRLTGAMGSGATAHAVITNGVVTSIVLDNPGDGAYTTFLVDIDPPQSIVVAGPFPSPINMALATDALPVVPEVEIPTISNT